MLSEKIEISFLHFVFFLLSKLFIGIGIGLMLSGWALPYSFPIILIGVAIFLPTLYCWEKSDLGKEKKILKKLK